MSGGPLGSHHIYSVVLGLYGSSTIAASMLGTAAATALFANNSAPFAYARSLEVWNYTSGDLELVAGADTGTAGYTNSTIAGGTNQWVVGTGIIFLPSNRGTAAMAQIRGERYPFKFEQGMGLFLRTTANTPVTCSAAAPLILNFWA